MALSEKSKKTQDHVLKTTRAILMANGFHNTTINDIIKATGVKKGNLYYHFSSKEEICLAVLEDAKEEFFTFLAQSLQGDSPCAKVVNSCQAIIVAQKKQILVGGCLFGNAALEMSDSNPRFATVLQDVFVHWVGVIDAQLSLAGPDCSLNTNLSPSVLAKAIVATIEGGIMMSRVSKEPADLDDCFVVIKAMLGK
ncbi:MAG: TetR/AcrR family transcriptional regulator [Desulfocapsa sp.]|nr:TetR/AcrR family transcriptional regulator [Desulfocapsa sp.]